MKAFGIISTATLFLLLVTAVPVLAQDDHHDEAAKPAQHEQQAKPAKQETKSAKQEPQSKPAQREQTAKPVTQQRQAKPAQRQEQAKTTKPETRTKAVAQARGNTGGNGHVQRTAAAERTQRAQPALRLSARGDSRIPDARFRSNFGRGHEFRIGSPRLVDGYSRFQYGGYWFGFVQPWPVDWYYTDDVYVDYINGEYYLCNPSYPGAQVAISVVL
jgi:hypothetical protein